MQFLKSHYEKILLSLVLLGLAGAAAWLPAAIDQAKKDLAVLTNALPKPKELKPVNLSTNLAALDKLKNPPIVELSPPHLAFNPVIWKQRADGTLFKIESSNPADKLNITRIVPLNLIIALEQVKVTGTNIAYVFAVTNQAARKFPSVKESFYTKPRDAKNKYFSLKEVQGPPDNPDSFILELNEGKQQVAVTKAKPFELLQGFSADLVYPIENKTFVDVRMGNSLTFGGDKYKVIAINTNEVRVQADSNDKQTTIKLKTAQ